MTRITRLIIVTQDLCAWQPGSSRTRLYVCLQINLTSARAHQNDKNKTSFLAFQFCYREHKKTVHVHIDKTDLYIKAKNSDKMTLDAIPIVTDLWIIAEARKY